jgi:hypothetical protein
VSEPVTLRTNDPSAPLLHLNVAAAVQAPVSVSPNRVRFEKVKVGEQQAVKVMVRATRPFRVRPVADEGDGLSAEAFPGPLPVQIVTVTFAPKAAGPVRKEIRFTTDLPGGATAVLAVEADAVPE